MIYRIGWVYNNNFLLSAKEFVIVQWNCFKLTRSRIEFGLFLERFKPDIMSIQEVKLNQEEANLLIRYDSYDTHYKPRFLNPSFVGGVVILTKNSIACSNIRGLDEALDNIGVRVEIKGLNLHVICLYTLSNTLRFNTFLNYSLLSKDLILLGDFNAKTPLVGCRSLDTNGRVLEKILSSGLDICVLNEEEPTFFS